MYVGGMATGIPSGGDGHCQPNWIEAKKVLLHGLVIKHVSITLATAKNSIVVYGGGMSVAPELAALMEMSILKWWNDSFGPAQKHVCALIAKGVFL